MLRQAPRPIFRTTGFYCMDTSLSVVINEKNVHSYSFMGQVQSDHFHEIFAPELDKHGYQALYKRKTNEVGSVMILHTPFFLCWKVS